MRAHSCLAKTLWLELKIDFTQEMIDIEIIQKTKFYLNGGFWTFLLRYVST